MLKDILRVTKKKKKKKAQTKIALVKLFFLLPEQACSTRGQLPFGLRLLDLSVVGSDGRLCGVGALVTQLQNINQSMTR